MTDHYTAQIKSLGHSIKAHGCEIGERSHKDFVHEPFIQTSRRRREMLMEMMLVQKRKKVASILQHSINESSCSRSLNDDNDHVNIVNDDIKRHQIRLSSLQIMLKDGVYMLFQREKKKLKCLIHSFVV